MSLSLGSPLSWTKSRGSSPYVPVLAFWNELLWRERSGHQRLLNTVLYSGNLDMLSKLCVCLQLEYVARTWTSDDFLAVRLSDNELNVWYQLQHGQLRPVCDMVSFDLPFWDLELPWCVISFASSLANALSIRGTDYSRDTTKPDLDIWIQLKGMKKKVPFAEDQQCSMALNCCNMRQGSTN